MKRTGMSKQSIEIVEAWLDLQNPDKSDSVRDTALEWLHWRCIAGDFYRICRLLDVTTTTRADLDAKLMTAREFTKGKP